MSNVDPRKLYGWCKIPVDELPGHPDLKVPFRMVSDSAEMGQIMARELVELIEANNAAGKPTRAIIPCGPACWYDAWCELINQLGVSLAELSVFHMDECLDWQGRLLPKNHPYNFRTFMEERFYGPIAPELNVPGNLIRAERGGIVVKEADDAFIGRKIPKGEVIARIYSLYGDEREVIKAPCDGYIWGWPLRTVYGLQTPAVYTGAEVCYWFVEEELREPYRSME